MTEYKQKTLLANKFEANQIINYLQDTQGFSHAGVFDVRQGGKIKIQSYGTQVEIMCNCHKEIVNKLQNLIEQNE